MASAAEKPARTGTRSSTDRGTIQRRITSRDLDSSQSPRRTIDYGRADRERMRRDRRRARPRRLGHGKRRSHLALPARSDDEDQRGRVRTVQRARESALPLGRRTARAPTHRPGACGRRRLDRRADAGAAHHEPGFRDRSAALLRAARRLRHRQSQSDGPARLRRAHPAVPVARPERNGSAALARRGPVRGAARLSYRAAAAHRLCVRRGRALRHRAPHRHLARQFADAAHAGAAPPRPGVPTPAFRR